MFDLDPAPIIPGDVLLTRPGTEDKAKVRFFFRHRAKRYVAALVGRDDWTDQQKLQDIIEGWEGITHKGEPVPYSSEALATLLDNFGPAALEIWDAYETIIRTGRLGN